MNGAEVPVIKCMETSKVKHANRADLDLRRQDFCRTRN